MKVLSTLADIEFVVGKVSRKGNDLIIESDQSSTMDTQIIVSRSDARKTLRKLVFNGSFWRFALSLPFRSRGNSDRTNGQSWTSRRSKTGLNKPW